jgi:protein-S-isoprenylcysteine O-methyltransferase Ste14
MGLLKIFAAVRLTLAAFREARPVARRLAFRGGLLFASVCVLLGAIASLFWALYEVLFGLLGPGWSAVATSVILWLFAWALWEIAWRIPLRRHPRPVSRRPPRRRAVRSRN